MAEVSREEYSWANAAADLALTSSLTLRNAVRLTNELDGVIHPFDAVHLLSNIVNGAEQDAQLFGYNLKRIILLKKVDL
jgi:hypothetical protein